MKRREFICGGSAAAAAWPLVAQAQQPEQVRRIGVLINLAAEDPEGRARLSAFAQALEQLGWSDGHNLRIDIRWAKADDIHKHAAEWPRSRRTFFSPPTEPRPSRRCCRRPALCRSCS